MSVTPEMFKKFLAVLPITTVNILIVKGDEVLLVKRLNEPAKGFWYSPGGIIRKGESVEENALRVCREESGLKVKLKGLLGVHDEYWEKGYFTENLQLVTVCYSATPLSGELRPDWQSSEVKWFPIDELPAKTGGTVKKMVSKAFN